MGLLGGAGVGFAQGFDQPILERSPQAFDPPFRRRAQGGDQLDAQLF